MSLDPNNSFPGGGKRKRKENSLIAEQQPMRYVNGWKVPMNQGSQSQASSCSSSKPPSIPPSLAPATTNPLVEGLNPSPVNLPPPDGVERVTAAPVINKKKKKETLWTPELEAILIDLVVEKNALEHGKMIIRMEEIATDLNSNPAFRGAKFKGANIHQKWNRLKSHYSAKFGLSHDGSNLSALPNYDTKDLPAHEREMYQIILREMKDERVKEFLTEKEKVREQTMLMHESLIVDLNSLVEEGDTGAEDSWCHMVSGDGVKEDAVAEGNTSGAEGESSLVRKQPKKTQKQLSQELRDTLPSRTPSATKSTITSRSALSDSMSDPIDKVLSDILRPEVKTDEERQIHMERQRFELERDRERWALEKKKAETTDDRETAMLSLMTSMAPMLACFASLAKNNMGEKDKEK